MGASMERRRRIPGTSTMMSNKSTSTTRSNIINVETTQSRMQKTLMHHLESYSDKSQFSSQLSPSNPTKGMVATVEPCQVQGLWSSRSCQALEVYVQVVVESLSSAGGLRLIHLGTCTIKNRCG